MVVDRVQNGVAVEVEPELKETDRRRVGNRQAKLIEGVAHPGCDHVAQQGRSEM